MILHENWPIQTVAKHKLFDRAQYRLLSMLMFCIISNNPVFFNLAIISECKRNLWLRSMNKISLNSSVCIVTLLFCHCSLFLSQLFFFFFFHLSFSNLDDSFLSWLCREVVFVICCFGVMCGGQRCFISPEIVILNGLFCYRFQIFSLR